MPSVEKIHRILELLRKNYKMGLTNKEISKALKIPQSTCYRILASLKKYNYVYQRKPDMKYFLGFIHLRFADAVKESFDLTAICLPYLEELHRKTEETTFLSLWNGNECVAVEVVGYIDTRIAVGNGEVMPLHCSAAGKAVLAFLPDNEKRRLLKRLDLKAYTDNTITSQHELEKQLENIKMQGVAYNFQEFHTGINALSTPIFNNRGNVIASITVVGIAIDLDKEQLEEYASLFLEASREITETIGGEFPGFENINVLEGKRER